jgi:hypothetical protein
MDDKGKNIYLKIKRILKKKQEENEALDRLIKKIREDENVFKESNNNPK